MTLCIHGCVYLDFPINIVFLTAEESFLKPTAVLLIPAAWSLYMLSHYRKPLERILGWCSLVLTVYWFLSAGTVRG